MNETLHSHKFIFSGVEGSWVLLSTNRGYQYPKRHGQRAISFKSQNHVNTNSPQKGSIASSESYNHEVYELPQPLKPTIISHQKGVKLTVLPAESNNSDISVSLYKPANGSSDDPYNGILEVAPSTEPLEQEVAIGSSISNPTKKKKNKNKQKPYNVMRTQTQSDISPVLAAVGAGRHYS